MKGTYRTILFLTITSLFLWAGPASAKGGADKITIVHPDLAEAIEVIDPQILESFSPWAGQFIDADKPLVEPPYVGLRLPYQVYFHHEQDSGELKINYMFYYYPDPSGDRGYIYLPGYGEPFYRVNIGTIIRAEADGRWHEAAPVFERKFRQLAPGDQVQPGGAGPRMPAGVILGSASGLLLLGAGIFFAGRRNPGREKPGKLRTAGYSKEALNRN